VGEAARDGGICGAGLKVVQTCFAGCGRGDHSKGASARLGLRLGGIAWNAPHAQWINPTTDGPQQRNAAVSVLPGTTHDEVPSAGVSLYLSCPSRFFWSCCGVVRGEEGRR